MEKSQVMGTTPGSCAVDKYMSKNINVYQKVHDHCLSCQGIM